MFRYEALPMTEAYLEKNENLRAYHELIKAVKASNNKVYDHAPSMQDWGFKPAISKKANSFCEGTVEEIMEYLS